MRKERSLWKNTADRITLLAVLLLGILTIIGSGGGDDENDNNVPDPPSSEITQVYGLNFSPYLEDQDPNLGATVDTTQISNRLEIISSYTQWIRTFGSTHGLEETGLLAHNLDLLTALGAWLDADLETNEQEISNLIAAGLAGDADLLIVGSEVLLRGDLTEAQLLEYIRRVKQSVPSKQVTYVDVYGILLDHPAILEAVDVVFVNYYPYWEGVHINYAMATIHRWHQQVVAAANGKEVIVSETGWPSDGEPYGNAVPSLQNASDYFLNFVSWANANAVNYFYFEAFDEAWKAFYEGSQGAHWGVWDKDGNLKVGMEAVFNGDAVEDNWSIVPIPGGEGDPVIEFVNVPAVDSLDNLEGQVWHVDPFEHRVVVYIYVSDWWIKPTYAEPLTVIQIDGSWTCDITTGGLDKTATEIAAFLVPADYQPPLLLDGAVLPVELYTNSLDHVSVVR